jgi:hypothetical protein
MPLARKHSDIQPSVGLMVNPAVIADFADALGLKPRSKPLSFQDAKKAVDKLYAKQRGKHGRSIHPRTK